MKFPINYDINASIATLIFRGTKKKFLRGYTGALNILFSITRFIVKYIFGKRYILNFRARKATHDGKTFLLYTLIGVPTTIFFWGFKFGFHQIYGTKLMRYLGGIIGLSIGYFTKYHLDQSYVFKSKTV